MMGDPSFMKINHCHCTVLTSLSTVNSRKPQCFSWISIHAEIINGQI